MRDIITPETERPSLEDRGVSADVRLDGEIHAMREWSPAGVSFETAGTPLREGEPVKMTLRFHLPEESVGVWIDGRVIRSEEGVTAVEFDDLSAYAQRRLARVIDGIAKSH
jgi:hypothetical protein